MEFLSLVPMLGREIGDTDLEAQMIALGADVPLATEVALETYYIQLKDAGLSFALEPEGEARQPLPYPVRNGALILTSVVAYGENELGYTPFGGELPQGLSFSSSRTDAHVQLGKPDWSSPAMPIDRWHAEDHRLILDFSDSGDQIISMSLELP